MAYAQEDKDKVRKSYISDRLSLDSVASVHGIPYQTVQRWKKQAKEHGDDWDKIRAAQTLAGGEMEDTARELLTDLIIIFKTTTDSVKSDEIDSVTKVKMLASLADSYHKAVSANKKAMPETDKLAIAMTVIEMLGKYIQEHKPELLGVFLEILEPFGELLAREFQQ